MKVIVSSTYMSFIGVILSLAKMLCITTSGVLGIRYRLTGG